MYVFNYEILSCATESIHSVAFSYIISARTECKLPRIIAKWPRTPPLFHENINFALLAKQVALEIIAYVIDQ